MNHEREDVDPDDEPLTEEERRLDEIQARGLRERQADQERAGHRFDLSTNPNGVPAPRTDARNPRKDVRWRRHGRARGRSRGGRAYRSGASTSGRFRRPPDSRAFPLYSGTLCPRAGATGGPGLPGDPRQSRTGHGTPPRTAGPQR